MPAGRTAVVKARAQRDHQIGAAARLVGGEGTVATDEAQGQRVGAADAAHAVGRGDDRNAQAVRQLGDLVARFRQRGAMADEQHGLVGGSQQIDGRGHVGFAGARSVRAVHMRGRRQIDVGFFLIHVVGDVQVHRTGTARDHGVHGLAQGQRQHVHPCGLEGALDDRAHHLREVGLVVFVQLLEGRAIVLRGRHVGGDGHEGRRIRQRGGQRHDHIGRARAGGGERGHRLVLDAKVGVGHVAGALLVARRDQLDLVTHVIERIEDADVAVTADAEDIGHLFLDQVMGDEFAALHGGHLGVSLNVVVAASALAQVRMVITRSSVISCTA